MKSLTIFVDMDETIELLLDVWLTRLNAIYNLELGIGEGLHIQVVFNIIFQIKTQVYME